MKQKAKEKLANVRMYGRRVSEFLLPDQMEFIEKAMIEFAQEQANGVDTGQDKCHIQRVSQQRELFVSFARFAHNYGKGSYGTSYEEMFSEWLKKRNK